MVKDEVSGGVTSNFGTELVVGGGLGESIVPTPFPCLSSVGGDLTPLERLVSVTATGVVPFTFFRGVALFLGARALADVVATGKELGATVVDELVFGVTAVNIEAVGESLDSVGYESKWACQLLLYPTSKKRKARPQQDSLLFLPFPEDDNRMDVGCSVFVKFVDSLDPVQLRDIEEVKA